MDRIVKTAAPVAEVCQAAATIAAFPLHDRDATRCGVCFEPLGTADVAVSARITEWGLVLAYTHLACADSRVEDDRDPDTPDTPGASVWQLVLPWAVGADVTQLPTLIVSTGTMGPADQAMFDDLGMAVVTAPTLPASDGVWEVGAATGTLSVWASGVEILTGLTLDPDWWDAVGRAGGVALVWSGRELPPTPGALDAVDAELAELLNSGQLRAAAARRRD